ncbi:junctional adhesion molecule 2A-like [Chironomus tepperi]|uniref:junctional adhesion molecule 2A-like n=1 Tax=Chironomus tepperi TaxID=113505 RepID=UPI00391F38D4
MIIKLHNWIYFLTTIMFIIEDLTVSSLGMVHITIPNAIQSGRNAILMCDYELEGDDLYSVKWYKGKREFFRYTAKEIPSIKTFHFPGIQVDVQSSNASRIVLNNVVPEISGKFSCEVSADAPSFQTHIVSGELQVVEFPEQSPSIDDIKQYYNVGDYLETNCTSNSSIPPATLEWWINDVPAHIEHAIRYDTVVDPISKRQTSILGLRLPLTNEHFYQGRLKLQCIARIYDIYEKDVTRYVEEQYPRILANSDNGGVHFSFISDRDAAGKSKSSVIQHNHNIHLIMLVLLLVIHSIVNYHQIESRIFE